MRTKIVAGVTNNLPHSCWMLLQNEDRTVHVQQEALYRDSERRKRVAPIDEFLLENGPPPRCLQKLIDRMFE